MRADGRVNVLFPVEGIDRELDFRLLLAGICADRTNRILIAQHDVLHEQVANLAGGVYVGKNVFPSLVPVDLARYHALREQGVSLVYLDEEGLVTHGQDPEVWRKGIERRLDLSCLRPGDRVCAWGDWQRDYYRSVAPSVERDIVTTGHPRFDLCKPAYSRYLTDQAAALRERFGPFILVNTSFGTGNCALGVSAPFSAEHGYRAGPSIRDFYFRMWLHERHLADHFLGLIYRVSLEMPDVSIVIRPHPAEDITLYEAPFRDSPNVHVVRRGSVNPWLLACEAMLHERCTTGIEAAIAGTPIVRFSPIEDEERAMYVPNLFGRQARTEDEAVAALAAAVEHGRREFDVSAVTPLAHELLANFNSDAFSAVSRVIARAAEGQDRGAQWFDEQALRRIVARRRVADAAKRPIRPLFAEKARRYTAFKGAFYGFSADEVGSKLRNVASLLGKHLRYRMHGAEAVVVESDE